jgi:hypothetical protein
LLAGQEKGGRRGTWNPCEGAPKGFKTHEPLLYSWEMGEEVAALGDEVTCSRGWNCPAADLGLEPNLDGIQGRLELHPRFRLPAYLLMRPIILTENSKPCRNTNSKMCKFPLSSPHLHP